MVGERDGKNNIALMLCINAVIVCAIVAMLAFYSTDYQNKIRQQNLTEIASTNESFANISGIFFQNHQARLTDDALYVTTQGYTLDEALSYICDSNSGGVNFELVGPDCKGYAAVRSGSGFVPVDYTAVTYESLAKVFKEPAAADASGIIFTPEFTDQYSARKSFALYTRLKLANSAGIVSDYTLMAIASSSDIADLIKLDSGYDGMSTVLVNTKGEYVLGSPAFKSESLFKYFYVFNDLSLDTERQLAEDFAENDEGTYYYKDGEGRDCVFVYTSVPNTAWRSVSCVPISSFRNNTPDVGYVFWIAGLLLIMMVFNILWLLRSNRRLKASALREQEASSAKTDFLSRMSHDIRTPLNVIIGSTILARREDNPPRTQEHLDNIDRGGKFLLSLVNDILDLNKVESGKMELYPVPYSFSQFRAGIETIIEPLCEEKNIEFTVTGTDSSRIYLLDRVRIDQIFFNILSNSVKFTDPGGHITLDCKELVEADGTSAIRFTASDDGRGMSREFQEKMFDTFSQERENESPTARGTGLGLAIVKNLVDLMGGSIRVESALGKGTTFFVTIPVVESEEQVEAGIAAAVDISSIRGKRILLFEDNEVNAQIATSLLEQEGAIVEHATDGAMGVKMFSASKPSYFDAMLMDLRMPVMDGIEATKAIRALPRDDARRIPIIAMTANAYDADVRKCLEVGMNAHLPKPIDPDMMLSTLVREIRTAGSGV